MPLVVRKVEGPEEHEKLYKFRYQVYVSEVKFTSDADHEKHMLKDEYDDIADNFAIFDGDEIKGSLRLLFLETVTDLEPFREKFKMDEVLEAFGPSAVCTTSRFMLSPDLRNGKIIFKLMRSVFEAALSKGVRFNFGDCSPHLIPFYEHLGYRRYTSGFNDSSFGYKIPILMTLRDHLYMSEIRSVLLGLSRKYEDDIEAREWFARTYPDFTEVRCSIFLEDNAFMNLLTERIAGDPVHHLSLIQGLDEEEVNKFLAEATLFSAEQGDLIIRKGDVDSSVYVLLKGLAEVKVNLEDKLPVTVLGSGDTFGEIGFLISTPRTAHVMAKTSAEVLVLTGDFMERFLRQQPLIAAKIALNLSKELAARLALTTKDVSKSS